MQNNINFATATPAQLEAAGYTFTAMPSTAKRRSRKSRLGVKPSANKKGCQRSTLSNANQNFTGNIQG